MIKSCENKISSKREEFQSPTQKGQATLAFILLVSGIIIEVAIFGSIIAFNFNRAALSEQLSLRALSAAHSGIYDARLMISRNKDLGDNFSYNFDINESTVFLELTRATDEGANLYLYTVNSKGVVKGRERTVEALIAVNRTTGSVEIKSLEEQ